MAQPARWIALGRVDPLELHATYVAIAEAAGEADAPTVVWGRSDRPHLSLGASQSAVELDLAACRAQGVMLVQRPLGGGTVLVDEHQAAFFVVLPRTHAPLRHGQLFDRCLPAAQAVFARFGLSVERVGRADLWLHGRKVLGSGAATLNRALVFGAAFLLRFDAVLFARLVRCPSPLCRDLLAGALAAGMTAWSEHAEVPADAALQAALQQALADSLNWEWRPGELSAAERAAVGEARAELEAGPAPDGRRLIAHGLKINERSYLVGEDDVCMLVEGGRVARVQAAEAGAQAALARCVGAAPAYRSLLARLDGALARAPARAWARRLDRLTADIRRTEHG